MSPPIGPGGFRNNRRSRRAKPMSEINVDDIVTRLAEIAPNGFDERIYVRGDRTASYGAIMRVMGLINGAGYRHIGLVSVAEPDS